MLCTWCALVLLVALALSSEVQAQTRSRTVTCDARTACYPWNANGPFCGRGANINMRFQMDLTKGNYIDDPGMPDPISTVTYAYCPRVDELQAFNLTGAGELAFTISNGTTGLEIMDSDEIYVRAIGFGDSDDVNFPAEGTNGRVMIADAIAQSLLPSGAPGGGQCEIGEIAVASFLILNVSLNEGQFQYDDGIPGGVGFQPTCETGDVCLLDSDLKCIGEVGMRNCAQCMTAEQAQTASVQIWVSYYGTDASGKTLRSGASNPLNFRVFSGAGIGTAMTRSYRNLDGDDEDLEP